MTISMFGEPMEDVGFETLPDGEYYVNGIEKWITTDSNDEPCYVTDEYHDGLVVKFELKVVGKDTGVACTRTPSQFLALASALGASLDKVTPKNLMSSATLSLLKVATDISDKQVKITARDGWVRWVDADVPESLYMVKFKGAHRADYTEGLEFLKGDFGPSLKFKFEVVGNGRGEPSIWNGHVFSLYINDPFLDSLEIDGNIITAHENGSPIFQRHGSNPMASTLLAERWKAFIKYFAPGVNEHRWETSPAKSEYGVDELASPQYVIIGEAIKASKTNLLQYRKRKKRRGIDLIELESLNEAEYVEEDTTALEKVLDFITSEWGLWEGKAIFDYDTPNPGTFTEAGKLWAKEHLQPAWDRAELGEKAPLYLLNDEQLEKLFVALQPEEVTEDGESW